MAGAKSPAFFPRLDLLPFLFYNHSVRIFIHWKNAFFFPSGGIRQNFITGVYQQHIPGADVYCPNLNFTTDELEDIGEIRATIKSYVNEQRTQYILGNESTVSDPEAFKAELEKIGLSHLLEVADAAYQRQYVD